MASIQKRNNSYKITVSLGYNADGKQIRRTMTYKPAYGMTKKQIQNEVKRQAYLFEEKCKCSQSFVETQMKLDEYITIYLETAKSTLSPINYEKYKRVIETYISPSLGYLKLKSINPMHIQNFVNELQKTSVKTKSGYLAPSSVRRYFTIVQSIFHSAYKLGLININPADGDRITLPRLQEQPTEIFTIEEVHILLDCLDKEPLQFKTLINMALNTGCRRGELVALKWSDINFDTNTLIVQRSNYKLSGSDIKSKETKSGRSRKITLSNYCIKLLKQHKYEQDRYALALGNKWNGDNWIFTQADGKPMYPSTPTLQFSRFLKRNNIEHRKFHALRHTSATLLLSSGTNIKNVASRLGHSQLKTTDRYLHAIEKADQQAANAFEYMLNTKRNKNKNTL